MNIAEAMIGEFSQESIGTRKMLERIPDDKLSWKPHEKSMTMGRLATHLAEIPEWAETIMNHESFDHGCRRLQTEGVQQGGGPGALRQER